MLRAKRTNRITVVLKNNEKLEQKNWIERNPSATAFLGSIFGTCVTIIVFLYTFDNADKSLALSKTQYKASRKDKIESDRTRVEQDRIQNTKDSIQIAKTNEQLEIFKRQADIANAQYLNQKNIYEQQLFNDRPVLYPSGHTHELDSVNKRIKLTVNLANGGRRPAKNVSYKVFILNSKTLKYRVIPIEGDEPDIIPATGYSFFFHLSPEEFNDDNTLYCWRGTYGDPPLSKTSFQFINFFRYSGNRANQPIGLSPKSQQLIIKLFKENNIIILAP